MMLTARTENEFASPYAREDGGPGLPYRMWRAFIRLLAIRQLRHALRAMPDWLLDDVGVKRSDIDSLAVRMVDGHDRLSLWKQVDPHREIAR